MQKLVNTATLLDLIVTLYDHFGSTPTINKTHDRSSNGMLSGIAKLLTLKTTKCSFFIL